VPSTKQEGWRYTGLKSLIEQNFQPSKETLEAVQPSDMEELLIPGLDAYRAVLVNGRYVPHLSDFGGLPRGVRAGSLNAILGSDPDALAPLLSRVAGVGVQPFSSLNTAGLDDGFVLLIDDGVVLERPVELIHLSVGMDDPRVAQPRHLVGLAAGAQADLIERYVSLGASLYCTNSVAEIRLERGARLTHARLQAESPVAFHISGVYLDQAGGSAYEGVSLGLGARWARTDIRARFSGSHAECDLKGLYLAGDGQLMDYHLDVDHAVPECASRESFKGILYGKGRAVFDGRILVAEMRKNRTPSSPTRICSCPAGRRWTPSPSLRSSPTTSSAVTGRPWGRSSPRSFFIFAPVAYPRRWRDACCVSDSRARSSTIWARRRCGTMSPVRWENDWNKRRGRIGYEQAGTPRRVWAT
jgi:Fe-S cluster assembly protein SufD